MAIEFNSATPAAPTGYVNAVFAHSSENPDKIAVHVPVGARSAMIPCYKSGKPDAGEVLLDIIPAIGTTFPVALAGSTLRLSANPAATKVFSYKKNGTEFGTLSIATDGTPTWAAASGAAFNGTTDYLQIIAPAVQDTTLAGVGMCLKVMV